METNTVVIDGYIYPAEIIELINAAIGEPTPEVLRFIRNDMQELKSCISDRLLFGSPFIPRKSFDIQIANNSETRRIAKEILTGKIDLIIKPLHGPAELIASLKRK